MSGRSCQIVGFGAGRGASDYGSVIEASSQSGPVIDFNGYVLPSSSMGKIAPLSGVTIKGSGVADPTKLNSGIKMKSMSSATFSDIAIFNTGGPCIELAENPGSGVYLCDFERIILCTPVSAKANDVPYFYANESNGNRFRGFGLRSISASDDVGVSGAVIIESNDTYSSHDNLFDAWWFEYLHAPDGGCIVSSSGNANTFSGFQFFDMSKESGASNTAYFRLLSPAASPNYGGNQVIGIIPGRSTSSLSIDAGVHVAQSNNRIVGVKGYKGYNVQIDSGVDHTYVHLGGSSASASTSAVVDNSGTLTNTYFDEWTNTKYRNGVQVFDIPKTDVQVFSENGTWSKPDGAVSVDVTCIGPGGGGGSGRRGAASTVRCGGGGGGSGGYTRATFPASTIINSVSVTVGARGSGGGAVSADDTNGNPGDSGGIVAFGSYVRATGGGGGSGGTTGAGAGGSAGVGITPGVVGGAASTTGGAGLGGGTNTACGPGGAGGGITSGDSASNGGTGGYNNAFRASRGAAGVVDTTSPTPATQSAENSGIPGGGAGGGAASITQAAQDGADSTYYGNGGGGGGASLNGYSSGAGGDGGYGVCIAVTEF